MVNEERWTVIRATIHFDELLEHVITTRKSVFIDGESKSAVLISIEEWIPSRTNSATRPVSSLKSIGWEFSRKTESQAARSGSPMLFNNALYWTASEA